MRRDKTKDLRKSLDTASALAGRVSSNKRLRDHVARAGMLALSANRRARRRFGRLAPLREMVADEELRSEVLELAVELHGAWQAVRNDQDLRREWGRAVRRLQSHREGPERTQRLRMRKPLVLAVATGSVVAIVVARSSLFRNRA
jgi:hypothetical protein